MFIIYAVLAEIASCNTSQQYQYFTGAVYQFKSGDIIDVLRGSWPTSLVSFLIFVGKALATINPVACPLTANRIKSSIKQMKNQDNGTADGGAPAAYAH